MFSDGLAPQMTRGPLAGAPAAALREIAGDLCSPLPISTVFTVMHAVRSGHRHRASHIVW
eukprot:3368772-Prymnesium_polylepis.1